MTESISSSSIVGGQVDGDEVAVLRRRARRPSRVPKRSRSAVSRSVDVVVGRLDLVDLDGDALE